MQQRRRRLLLALTTLPLLAQARDTARQNRADVIVLGAGIAGIASARELRRLGYSVLVLEARARIGGRIWTDQSLGVPIDMGGAWIHGVRGNPLTALVASAGIKSFASDWDAITLYHGKRALNEAQLMAANQQFEAVMAMTAAAKARAGPNENLGDTLRRAQDQLLGNDRVGAAVRWQVWSAIGSEYGVDADALSLASWNEDDEFSGDHVLLDKGYGALIDKMARGLDIRLSTVVQRVTHGASGVKIRTSNGEFSADAVICSLPLGVLQFGDVQFDPPLPANHQTALAHLDSGALAKVALRFPEVFWPATHTFARIDGNPERYCEFYNLQPMHKAPILLALTGGRHSRSLEAMSDTAVRDAIMRELRHIFGNIPAPTHLQRTRWASDPFTRGSYSIMPPGAAMRDFAALAKPAGTRLFMAGEATAPAYPGTVHGAYLSGLTAAQALAAL